MPYYACRCHVHTLETLRTNHRVLKVREDHPSWVMPTTSLLTVATAPSPRTPTCFLDRVPVALHLTLIFASGVSDPP